jgi:hypothetical protein
MKQPENPSSPIGDFAGDDSVWRTFSTFMYSEFAGPQVHVGGGQRQTLEIDL